jgi:hypothetical protein
MIGMMIIMVTEKQKMKMMKLVVVIVNVVADVECCQIKHNTFLTCSV